MILYNLPPMVCLLLLPQLLQGFLSPEPEATTIPINPDMFPSGRVPTVRSTCESTALQLKSAADVTGK